MAEPQAVHPKSTPAIPDLTGMTVGRFDIRIRLGQTRMSEVYLAEDTKLKRPVALKRMSPELRTDEHFRQRFLREAEHASCLVDQHIASVYEWLEEKDETFLVMEYVEGTTLRPRLKQPFALAEFLPVAIQCAEALAVAHGKGIIHRDIKPENIMLTPKGQVKILDFGIAKRLPRPDDTTTTASTTSQPGTLSGTPAYMPPEVLLEKPPDERSDIFSLGVVFYEMLAGRHPFKADTFMATSDRIRYEDPPPLGLLNPQVPPALERLVARMLAKDPAERYAQAAELVTDLRALEEKEPPRAALLAALRRWVNRRKFVLAVVGAILLVAVVPFIMVPPPPPPPPEPKWVLIADFENRTGDEFFDFTPRQLLTLAVEQSRFFIVFPRSRITETLRLMGKPPDTRLDPAIAREICLRENLPMFISGEVIPGAGGYQVAVRAVDAQSEVTLAAVAEPLSGKQGLLDATDRLSAKLRESLGEEPSVVKRDSVPLERATTRSLEALERFSRALDLQARGKVDEALALMKAAVELDPEFALAHSRMALTQMALGAEEEALASSSLAYGLRDRVSERERYQIQANYHSLRLDYGAALEDFRTLSVLYPRDSTAYGKLAEFYALSGNLEAAVRAARQAVTLYPKSIPLRGRLIDSLTQASRSDEALREIEVARALGADAPTLAGGEAFARLMKGDVARARQALQTTGTGGGPYYENLERLSLAQLSIYEGKLGAAAGQLESDIRQDLRTGNESYAADRRYWLARLYLLLGQRKLALAHLDALSTNARLSPIRLHQLRQAGLVYAEMGEVSRAQRVLRQVEQLQAAFPSNFSKAAVAQLRGALKQAAGAHTEALQDLEQARALWGGVLVAWSLASYWDERGDYEKALDSYRELLTRKGEALQWDFVGLWVIAHLQAARCYRDVGNDKEAVRLYDEFLHLWGTEAKEVLLVKTAREELRVLRSR